MKKPITTVLLALAALAAQAQAYEGEVRKIEEGAGQDHAPSHGGTPKAWTCRR